MRVNGQMNAVDGQPENIMLGGEGIKTTWRWVFCYSRSMKSFLPWPLLSSLARLHCARVCNAMKSDSNSQFGFVRTPRTYGTSLGDLPSYGPRNSRFES